jgi:hypothetical protein
MPNYTPVSIPSNPLDLEDVLDTQTHSAAFGKGGKVFGKVLAAVSRFDPAFGAEGFGGGEDIRVVV